MKEGEMHAGMGKCLFKIIPVFSRIGFPRLRASALYLSVIVSVVIAVITGSLIMTAYFYRAEYQKNLRYKALLYNLESATAIVLSDSLLYEQDQKIDLYGEETDSVLISKKYWGVFDVSVVQAFRQGDTLRRAFFMGMNSSHDQVALHLSDEGRPLSLSGKTSIRGDAVLPKSGVNRANVEGRRYEAKELVYGGISNSTLELPELDRIRIGKIDIASNDYSGYEKVQPYRNSFFSAEKRFYADSVLSDLELSGQVIIFSDTVLKISKTARLDEVIIYAPAVVVEEGFQGSCQIFATDSIVTGKDVRFSYPSCLGIIKSLPGVVSGQPKLSIGANNTFAGILFTYEKQRSTLRTMVSLGEDTRLEGEIYVSGFIKFDKPVYVAGKVSANRILIRTAVALYENYLIDIVLDRPKLDHHYLSSALFNRAGRTDILKWLN